MSVSINGTNGLTFNDGSTQTTAATGFGFKNRLINGDMRIDQRNAGASITPTNGQFSADRWLNELSAASKYTIQQSTTAPAGFTNSLLVTSSSAYTVGASEVFNIHQRIEGLNVADLAWGTASAAAVTLSFKARSSLTGTFGGAIQNDGNNRSYPFTFSISSANTWEDKTVTIPGDTSGTWLTTNGIGLRLRFSLGAGSTVSGTAGAWAGSDFRSATGAVSVVGTNGATFAVTGVQLEKGSTATSFDYRPYGTELALCQRYFQIYQSVGLQDTVAMGNAENTTRGYFLLSLPVSMRSAPACTLTATNFSMRGTTSFVACTSGSMGGTGGLSNSFIAGEFNCGSAHGAPAGGCVKLSANSVSASTILISSEL